MGKSEEEAFRGMLLSFDSSFNYLSKVYFVCKIVHELLFKCVLCFSFTVLGFFTARRMFFFFLLFFFQKAGFSPLTHFRCSLWLHFIVGHQGLSFFKQMVDIHICPLEDNHVSALKTTDVSLCVQSEVTKLR